MMRVTILFLASLLVLGSSSEIPTKEKVEAKVSKETSQPNEDSVKIKREPQHEFHGKFLNNNNNIGGERILGGAPQSFSQGPHVNVQSSGFVSRSIGGLNQGGLDIVHNAGLGHTKPVNIHGSIGGLGQSGLGHGNVFNNAGSSNLGGGGLAQSRVLDSLSGINLGFSNAQSPSLLGGNTGSHVLDTGSGGGLHQGNFGGGATTPTFLVLSGNQLPSSFNAANLGALQGSGGVISLNSLGGQSLGQHGGHLPINLQHSLAAQHAQFGFGNLGHSFNLGSQGILGQGIQGAFGKGGVDLTGGAGGNFVGSGGFDFGHLGLIGRSHGVGEPTLNFGNQGLGTGGGGFTFGGNQVTLGQVGKGGIEQGGQGTFGQGDQGALLGGQGTLAQGGPALVGQGGQGAFGHGGPGFEGGHFVGSGGLNFGNQGFSSGSFGGGRPTFHLGNQGLGVDVGGFSFGGFGNEGFGIGTQGLSAGGLGIGQGLLSNVGGQSLFVLDPNQYGYGLHAGNIPPLTRGTGAISQGGSILNGIGPYHANLSGSRGRVGHRFGSGNGRIIRNRGENPVKFHSRVRIEANQQRYGIPNFNIVRGLLTNHKTDGVYKNDLTNHLPQVIPLHFERYSRGPSYDRMRRKKNAQKQEEIEAKGRN